MEDLWPRDRSRPQQGYRNPEVLYIKDGIATFTAERAGNTGPMYYTYEGAQGQLTLKAVNTAAEPQRKESNIQARASASTPPTENQRKRNQRGRRA